MKPEVSAHAAAYDNVVRTARELVRNTRCHCHHCWTSRGMHDPEGCLWEDLAMLREATNQLEEAETVWRQASRRAE